MCGALGAGDRVLIPGGRHIMLDVSTPALAEVMVQGRLEVAAAEQELTLRAGRVAVDFGGTFQAGSPAAPLPGRFNLVLDRGGLVYLGGSGLLAGSALLAVGAGSVSLVGERDEVQQSNMLAIRCAVPPPPLPLLHADEPSLQLLCKCLISYISVGVLLCCCASIWQ